MLITAGYRRWQTWPLHEEHTKFLEQPGLWWQRKLPSALSVALCTWYGGGDSYALLSQLALNVTLISDRF